LAQTAAARSDLQKVPAKLVDLPSNVVVELHSRPGESLESFLGRVGGELRTHSKSSGYQTCGAVAVSQDGCAFGIIAATNEAHMGCVTKHERVPPGMHFSGETIHSPGTRAGFITNARDRVFLRELYGVAESRVLHQNVTAFSAIDYASGPGYLATDRGVMFQNGEGTDRLLRTDVDRAEADVRCAISNASAFEQ
jgi:hypothetical protein